MNDRELLEKAAKAAGYVVDWSAWDYTGLGVEDDKSETGRIMPTLNGAEWNPLTDDGDRYRLARDLKLLVDFETGQVLGPVSKGIEFTYTPGDEKAEAYAIVRAAAAMAD